MKRSTRNTKRAVLPISSSSSEDEDDNPVQKKTKTPIRKKNKVPKDTDESSSESDIENYLQPVDKINLMDTFFDVHKKDVPEKVEKDIFAGVERLSDSESEEDVEMKENNDEEKNEFPMEVITSENVAKEVFQNMKDYNKQLEEAKLQIAEYEANKKKKEENNIDISHLLIKGENVAQNVSSIRMEDLHSSDFESAESDDGWEEIKTANQEEKKEESSGVPSTGLQIIVDMPDAVKKKKGVDLVAALKRRLNRIRKENQVYVHKVHLLCMMGHGNYVNSVINQSEILKSALKLMPSEKAYPSDRIDLEYLEKIVKWYKKTMKLNEKDSTAMPLDKALKEQIQKKEVYNKNMLAYIFIAIMRALGVQCRLVISLQVEPLRPPASELHSLSTKTEESKKASSQLNEPSTSKAKTVSNKINLSKLNLSKAKKPTKETKPKEENNKLLNGKDAKAPSRAKSPKPKTEDAQSSKTTKPTKATRSRSPTVEKEIKSKETKDPKSKKPTAKPEEISKEVKSEETKTKQIRGAKPKKEEISKESQTVTKATRSRTPTVEKEIKSEEIKDPKAKKSTAKPEEISKEIKSEETKNKQTRGAKPKKEEVSKESEKVSKATRSRTPTVEKEIKSEETKKVKALEVPKTTRSKTPVVMEEDEKSSKEETKKPSKNAKTAPKKEEPVLKKSEVKKATKNARAKKEETTSKESLEVPRRGRSKSPNLNKEKSKSPLIKMSVNYDKEEVVVNKQAKKTAATRSTRNRNGISQLDGTSDDYSSEKEFINIHPQYKTELTTQLSVKLLKNFGCKSRRSPQLCIKLFKDYCASPVVNDTTKEYQSFILPIHKPNKVKKSKLPDRRRLVVKVERMDMKNLKNKVLKKKMSISKVSVKKTVIVKKNTKKIIKIKWPARRKTVPQVDGIFDYSSESDVPMDISDDEDETTEESDVEYITNLLIDSVVDAIPQVDGADDFKAKKSTKPNLKKLKATKDDSCPKMEKCSKRLKVDLKRLEEKDSGDEFSSPRTPFSTRNTNSPQINLSKLKNKSLAVKLPKKSTVEEKIASMSKYHSPPKKQKLDVKDEVMKLVKTRIKEQKQIDKSKMAKKIGKKVESDDNSDSDSDYAPDPIEKKHHGRDDEFVPKVKVKQRVSVNRKVLSKSKLEAPKKKGNDVWCEVFLEAEEKWISVDVVFGQIHCVKEIFSRATHPISYVLGWNNDNKIRDISARYCQNFNTVTRKLRIDAKWWESSLKPFQGTKNVRDKEEDDEMERQQLEKPLPTVISEYKNHPLYVLERHLLKFEAIYPPEPPILGYVRKEPVFPRSCVYICKSRDIWLKEAKTVKMGEQPYRTVKARPKYDRLSNKKITDQMLEVFGPWQTEDYDPPTAENGVVPRNAFGNVDLFKPSMLPKKCVHLQLPGLNKIARKLNIDCASAIVGFDFHGGFSHPTYDGFVVCEEFKDKLIAAWEEEQVEIEKKEEEKIDKRVYGNWKKLIKGLLIRERLKKKYDFGETSGEVKKKKELKVTNKRKIESDSE